MIFILIRNFSEFYSSTKIVIAAAWAVRHVLITKDTRFSETQTRIIMTVAEFPQNVHSSFDALWSMRRGDPPALLALLMDKKMIEQPNWIRRFPAPEDNGYLLFSGVDPEVKKSIVKLIRISDGKILYRWAPDWNSVFEKHTPKKFVPEGSSKIELAVHPLLLADGDIIFNTSTSLVRLSPCSSKPIWVIDEVMHHSIELDVSGTSVWIPSVSQDGFSENPWLRDNVRDDALAQVSTDGRIVARYSFVKILRDNGMEAMLLGRSGGTLNEDPIHLNQIKAASQDTKYWHKGDLLISARHLSTLFLYRPSTNKIIWYQTGPWMNQHSVDFVDEHRISVFDNHIVVGAPKEQAFMKPGDTNHVLVYDFDTKQISEPYATLLAKTRPVTITSGRARILPDGGLFIEETDYGRLLRFTRDNLLWSRINDYDEQRNGTSAWSRYLTEEEANVSLRGLASRQCDMAK